MAESFVVNVADANAFEHPLSGVTIDFDVHGHQFRDTGINIQVLQPGQPSCKYHAENVQEDFLVLAGECLLLLDGEERPLRTWDFVHCEPGAVHVFVGAGDAPCWLLQVGARREGQTWDYPPSELAAQYGAEGVQGGHPYSDWPDDQTRSVPAPAPPR
jgi:uncharacterized cupin superfamily protein